jgi:hypothetical protein
VFSDFFEIIKVLHALHQFVKHVHSLGGRRKKIKHEASRQDRRRVL